MKVELSATGTPQQIVASLGKDVEREKKANPGNSRVLHAVRDELYALSKKEGTDPKTGEETGVSVTVKATIDIEVSAAEKVEGTKYVDAFNTEPDAPPASKF